MIHKLWFAVLVFMVVIKGQNLVTAMLSDLSGITLLHTIAGKDPLMRTQPSQLADFALAIDPTDESAHFMSLMTELESEIIQIDDYNILLDSKSTRNQLAWYHIGNYYFQAGDMSSSIAMWEQGGLYQVIERQAYKAFLENNWAFSEAAYETLVIAFPNEGLNWYYLAHATRYNSVDDDSKEYIDFLKEGISLDPACFRCYEALVGEYILQESWFEVIFWSQEAQKTMYHRSLPYLWEINAYMMQQQYQSAINVAQYAISIYPNEPQLYFDLMTIYTVEEDFDNALAASVKLLKYGSNNPRYQFRVAELYAKVGNQEGALKLFETITDLDWSKKAKPWIESLSFELQEE